MIMTMERGGSVIIKQIRQKGEIYDSCNCWWEKAPRLGKIGDF